MQIKDKFIWTKGDSDTVNATGGAKTVTLAVDNLPSHNHTFTGAEQLAKQLKAVQSATQVVEQP